MIKFICNSSIHNTAGCLDTSFCELNSTTTSPYSCSYDTSNIPLLDINLTNVSFNVYLYDSNDNLEDYFTLSNIYLNE